MFILMIFLALTREEIFYTFYLLLFLIDVKHGWLYSHGIVTPVSEEIAKRIMGEAPQFLNNLSIRDRW